MHPEDAEALRVGEAYAKAEGGDFFRANLAHFMALVTEYGDAEAHEQLDALRDRFWASCWKWCPHAD